MNKTITFDFDNTIICYEDIFYKLAVEKKLIKESFPKKKKLIREKNRINPEHIKTLRKRQDEALNYKKQIEKQQNTTY